MAETEKLIDADPYMGLSSIPIPVQCHQSPPLVPPLVVPQCPVPVVPSTVPPESGANIVVPPNPANYPVIVIQPTATNPLGAGSDQPIYVTVNITNHTNSYAKNNRVTFCEDCCEDLCENVCFFCCWSKGRGKVDADPAFEPLMHDPCVQPY